MFRADFGTPHLGVPFCKRPGWRCLMLRRRARILQVVGYALDPLQPQDAARLFLRLGCKRSEVLGSFGR